jgi:hypothetical protein
LVDRVFLSFIGGMKKQIRFTAFFVTLLLGLCLFSLANVDSSVRAQALTPTTMLTPSPTIAATSTSVPAAKPRLVKSQVKVDGFEWWLVTWNGNTVVCDLTIDHGDLPIGSDVLNGCGDYVYNMWANKSGSCTSPNPGKHEKPCKGVYMIYIKPVPILRDVTVDVPPPSALVSLSPDCSPAPPSYRCGYTPSLVISGVEPMDGQSIVSIEGDLDSGAHFKCESSPCNVALSATAPAGMHLSFWVNSSFGDSSKHYSAAVRVLPLERTNNRAIESLEMWQVDVATAQWQGAALAACSQSWDALPEAHGLPDWLSTPTRIEAMASSNKYYYLAGALIRAGQVSVQGCQNFGLEGAFIANFCGLQKAAPLVVRWQNQFDAAILVVAKTENMPAMLIKSLIGRESQFWPGVFSGTDEVGLGQLTEGGADTLFMWNPEFFGKFCSSVFAQAECNKGYNNIPEYEKAVLKGALLSSVNTSCSGCLATVNLEQASFSVDVLSSSLKANCEQTGQLVYNLTGKAAGLSASYEDLWRFTLVNYNAGPGCLKESIKKTTADGLPLTWENISTRLESGCQGAIRYVADITQNPGAASKASGETALMSSAPAQATPTPLPPSANPTTTPLP